MPDEGKASHSLERAGLMARVAPNGSIPTRTLVLAAVVLLGFFLLAQWGIAQFEPKPAPVVDLEVARSGAAALRIVSAWEATGSIDEARNAITADFGLIVAYALGLAVLCLLARRIFMSPAVRSFGFVLARAVLLAGALDVVENIAMLRLIATRNDFWSTVAATAAWPKFMILLVAVLYVAFAAIKALLFLWLAGPRAPAAGATKPPPEGAEVFSAGERPSWRRNEWDPAPNKIGVSCSGGGVRSAAYNLGALQVMTERGLMAKARYLTAVSGGSYIAGAMTIMRKGLADAGAVAPPFAARSAEEEHFRNNSSYLAPGIGGKAWLVVRLLLGMLVNVLFLWLLFSVLAKPIGWLLVTRWLHPGLATSSLDVPLSMWAPIGATASAALIFALAAIIVRFTRDRWYYRHLRIAGALLALSMLLLLLLAAIPAGIVFLARTFGDRAPGQTVSFGGGLEVLQGAGILTVVGSTLKSIASKNKMTVALAVGGLVAPLLAVVTFLTLAGNSVAAGIHSEGGVFGFTLGEDWMWFAGMSVVLFWFYRYSDQTTWSMHPFYKRRLCTVFAQEPKPGGGAGPIDYDRLQPLSDYATAPGWPEFIVCAAANISDQGETPPRRNSVSFVFSASEVGGPRIGWLRTPTFEGVLGPRRKEDITLPAAIAISGAAISPGMGKMTYGQVSPLIALANARLGVWLPNPRWIAFAPGPQDWWSDRPRVVYLLKEILGRYSRDDAYLYVTDGGHWDNMGLVELLRRGCTKIYCFDAAGDHTDTFFTFGEAIAIARSELGVEFEINPEVLKPNADQRERNRVPHDVVGGTFTYPNKVKGNIVLAKAGVREDAPWDVRAYADKDKRFPTHGLMHQLFTDKNFEAYRSLGRFAAENAIAKMNAPATV